MPSTDVFDPTNYLAVVSGATPWHNGTGTITYSFLSSIPSYYASGSGFDVGGVDFASNANPSLSVAQRAMAELAVARYNEVANVRLTPAGGGAGGPVTGAPITGNGDLVSGLGGAAGFGETTVPRADDDSFEYSLTSVFGSGLNFFGTTYTSMFVNTNGSISFGDETSAFTPTGISGSTLPIIAAFFADVDTSSPALEGAESGQIHVDFDTVQDIVTITWRNVNFFDANGTKQNSFQIQLFDRGSGNFDIVLRYDDINWTTGDFSGGVNGLGGTVARAGYSAGNGSNFYELAASGNQAAMLALDTTAGNTGVTGLWQFEVRNGVTTLGNVTFGSLDFQDDGLYGFAYLPSGAGISGDVWLNEGNSIVASPTVYDEGWDTFIHELGHALGLDHPFEGVTLPSNLENSLYTVMSYDPVPAQAGIADPAQQFPATPMLYDIQALQVQYGANMSTRTGDDVYFATDAGGFAIANGETIIATIWDAGGADTFSGANQTSAVSIDLRPGYFSTIGRIQDNIGIALGVPGTTALSADIENAIGGSAGDTLTGNTLANRLEGGGGGDTLNGREGADTLLGGAGADMLTGGSGADVFLYTSGTDSTIAARDTIMDFVGGLDFINVSAADAGQAAMQIAGGFINVFFGNDGAGNFSNIVTVQGDLRAADIVTSAAGINVFGSTAGDTLISGTGSDFVFGDEGADFLVGQTGADRLLGGNGADTFFYGGAVDSTLGAFDTIYDFVGGLDILNLFFADQGQVGMKYEAGFVNVFFGNAGGNYSALVRVEGDIRASDILTSTGSINVFGSTGADTLISGVNADFVFGDAGNDFIVGQTGADRLVGGAGSDTFFYGGQGDSRFSARDQVLDFESGADKLHVFFADAGQVALRYVGGYTEVYFGNDGTGNFSDMIEVYGDQVQASDLITSDPGVFVFP